MKKLIYARANTMSDEIEQIKVLQIECWNRALHDHGTSYVFELRAKKYKRLLNWLHFLGLIVPLVIGSFILSISQSHSLSSTTIFIAGVLGTIQLTLSLLSLVFKWDDSFSYATESMNSNQRLSSRFAELAANPPKQLNQFQRTYDLLKVEDEFLSQADYKQQISEKEKRQGMRAGLYKFQRACAICGQVPKDMIPTNCQTCGGF